LTGLVEMFLKRFYLLAQLDIRLHRLNTVKRLHHFHTNISSADHYVRTYFGLRRYENWSLQPVEIDNIPFNVSSLLRCGAN
jgi:hypothetical protein